jgi:hypothetical protein
MDMKKAGVVLLAIGLLITLITGFSYFTREKMVDIGELHISANKKHHISWSPFVGIGVMVVGAAMALLSAKKA